MTNSTFNSRNTFRYGNLFKLHDPNQIETKNFMKNIKHELVEKANSINFYSTLWLIQRENNFFFYFWIFNSNRFLSHNSVYKTVKIKLFPQILFAIELWISLKHKTTNKNPLLTYEWMHTILRNGRVSRLCF